MSTPAPTRPSDAAPIEAASDAFAQTRVDLLPFKLERWLLLGVVAFLDQCGRGGVGGTLPGMPGAPPGGGGGTGGGLGRGADLDLALIAAIAVAVLVVVAALVALAVWIGSRGVFVYVHCVSTGRAELREPWQRHARLANSFFLWRLGLAGAVLVALLGIFAVGGAVAFTATREGAGLGSKALVVLLVALVPLFMLLVVAAGLASMALRDFVAPLQIAQGTTAGPAVRLLLGLIRAHPLNFFLYVVLKIVFGIAQGIVILLAACLTCCCALLPVVAQTVLQPVFYFERAWSLHLLRRMGYDLMRRPAAGAGAAVGGTT